MHLSHLEIFGFKSFAQKVQIPFAPGITAIVGPNGCGKSNIVEAIRWVLGEQRAGTFRSHRMEEVIFAGTRNRKPLGMAEVSMVVENTEGILPIEFSQVTIARRLFRSGESDYLLNKVPCRLLDIQNLLMDTGLGPGAYSVMEQGMVDEIISEKTENRRRILEEAAGITKYKARRRSTWKRLESVQADLRRLEDIIAEVERQVAYLGRQVGRARRYQELKRELDALEVRLGRFRFFALSGELRPLQEEFARLEQSAQSGYTRLTAREAELEKRRLALTEAEKALREVRLELNRSIEQIHATDTELTAVRERLQAAAQFLERASAEKEEHSRQLEDTRRQRRDAAQSLEAARERLAHHEEQLRQCEAAAAGIEQRCEEERSALESDKTHRLEQLRAQGECSRALERLRAEEEGLQERREQVRGELARGSTERRQLQEQRRGSAAARAEIEARLQQLQHQEEQIHQRLAEVEAQLRRLDEERGALRRSLEANSARLNLLEKIRSGYEGYSSGVRTLMLDSPHKELFEGVLGDLIEVEPRYHRAVETALGEGLEALVAARAQGVLEAIHYAAENQGRAGIFPLEWQCAPAPAARPSFAGLLGPLGAHIRTDPRLEPLLARLLHNTFLVEDLAPVLEQAATYLDQGLRFVTLAGDSLDPGGRVAGGRHSGKDESVLDRRRRMGQLKSTCVGDKAHLALLEGAHQSTCRRRAVLRARRERLRGALGELGGRRSECSHLEERFEADAARLLAHLEQLEGESVQIEARLRQGRSTAQVQQEEFQTLERKSDILEAQIGEREKALRRSEAARREKLEQLAALRVERARTSEKTGGLERDGERLDHIEQGLEKNIARLERESAQTAEKRRLLLAEQERLNAELEQMHQEREAQAAATDARQQHWQEVMVHNRELEESISHLQRELRQQREQRHQLELKIAALQSDAAHIEERLRQEQQVEIAAMGPLGEEDFDGEAAAARAGRLRQSILRLGTVHLGVLEEYEEQKERCEFLLLHRDDLLAAAEDLKKTLSRIDRAARRLFLETYEKIRLKFKETFARFFPGGEADLSLEPGVDPLEAAIEISARPRGKRLQNIALLSGGERALAAISLLFAIYQVKPSPWCILDEVDAPLDDTNIECFVRVLKEFARRAQFILVTHNKLSMAAADTLHGVTMPEEGMSQLVSVQVEGEELDEAAG